MPIALASVVSPLWWKVLLGLAVLALAYWAGRAGNRLIGFAARFPALPVAEEVSDDLISEERSQRYWRLAGLLWWAAVSLGAFSFLVQAYGLPIEPFATWGRQLSAWLGAKGLTGLLILALLFLAYRAIPRLLGRIPVPVSVEFSRQQVRVQTLKGVLETVLRVLVIALGGLLLLSNLGLNVTTLLAGAGVVGLAGSFAAQNLIRDMINGFFILLEDQYGVGDIVNIGGTGGVVERFNLRLTVLRDLEGRVHFIPNSQVQQVTVMSRDWARALVDVSVAYKEDVDRALEVVRDEVEQLYHDPGWRDRFTAEAPQVLGVDQLTDSAVVIRVLFNTRPKEQWDVAREFRRRIKNRLDAEGIEVPFPQTQVWLASKS